MHIAFVEVRDKTALFARVARELQPHHDVSWLVQNAAFLDATMSNVTRLPYPTKTDIRSSAPLLEPDQAAQIERVAATDRFVTTFRLGDDHYTWYYRRIRDWFLRTRPDVVFGEVGNFHSHMVALIAEEHGVEFLNPVSSRYPGSRFAFFRSDRLRTVGGDPAGMPRRDVVSVAEKIRLGTYKPDYMTIHRDRIDAIRYRLQILNEWRRGERYATQPPTYFLRESLGRRRLRQQWDDASLDAAGLSRRLQDVSAPKVLYPLQMQPELNLDVWGRDFREQSRTIGQLASSEAQVVVKPNPKSFHELDHGMVANLSRPNVLGVKHEVRMDEIESTFDLVVTASGTIAIERMLRGRPVAILLEDYARWLGVPAASDLGIDLRALDRTSLTRITSALREIEPADVLQRLVASSYPGVISEPRFAPDVMSAENVGQIAAAIEHVVSTLPKAGANE